MAKARYGRCWSVLPLSEVDAEGRDQSLLTGSHRLSSGSPSTGMSLLSRGLSMPWLPSKMLKVSARKLSRESYPTA